MSSPSTRPGTADVDEPGRDDPPSAPRPQELIRVASLDRQFRRPGREAGEAIQSVGEEVDRAVWSSQLLPIACRPAQGCAGAENGAVAARPPRRKHARTRHPDPRGHDGRPGAAARPGAGAVRAVPRRVLARAGPATRVPRRLRRRPHRVRLPRRAHPHGVRRGRARDHRGLDRPRGDQPLRRALRGLPRPDVHDGRAAQARQRAAEEDLPPRDRRRVDPAPGLLDHRARGRLEHHRHPDHGDPRRRRLRHHRTQELDEPHRAVRPRAGAGPHQPARPRTRPSARRASACSWSTSARSGAASRTP